MRTDREEIICDEIRPGIELLHLKGTPGYEDEEIIVSNSLSNGLRIEIANEGTNWISFHIQSPMTAVLIAHKLQAWCMHIADPPSPKEDGK